MALDLKKALEAEHDTLLVRLKLIEQMLVTLDDGTVEKNGHAPPKRFAKKVVPARATRRKRRRRSDGLRGLVVDILNSKGHDMKAAEIVKELDALDFQWAGSRLTKADKANRVSQCLVKTAEDGLIERVGYGDYRKLVVK